MTKSPINNLMFFIAGSIVALGCAALFSYLPGRLLSVLHSDGLAGFMNAGFLIAIIVGCLAVAFCVAYWERLGTIAGSAIRRHLARVTPSASGAGGSSSVAQNEIRVVREELERQLGRLIVLIATQLERSEEHVTSLRDVNAHLASVTNIGDLRDVIRSVITRNETNRQQTRDLEARLREAQDQATTLRQRLSQAEKLASLDPLTSVANRRRFEQFISTEVDKSHVHGTPLCLIMTDIDHFKRVNDNHGHSAGDRVLKAFADLLSANVREHDLVARYGGEEFAVVLPQTPMGDAFGIAERIRTMLELYGGPDASLARELGCLTASFGVAEIRDGEPPSTLVQRTDQVLYEAKSKGRNRTMVWSSVSGICDGACTTHGREPSVR